MIKSKKLSYLFLLLLVWVKPSLASLSSTPYFIKDQKEVFDLQTYETFSRISILINPSIKPVFVDGKKTFKIFFPEVSLLDIGIKRNELRNFNFKIKEFRDSRVKDIKLKEEIDGISFLGEWRFPNDKDSPAFPKMQNFQFMDENPSRFVLDFWHRPGLSRAEVNRREELRKRKLSILKEKKKYEEMKKVRFAKRALKKKVVAMDLFCGRPVNEENEIFLPFRPVHRPVKLEEWVHSIQPDKDYPYFEPKAGTMGKEGDYLRLALRLYRKGDFGLTIRTIDFYESDFSKSPHYAQMKFLKANALLKLGYVKKADRIFDELMNHMDNMAVALHSGIYIAVQTLKNKEYLKSLEYFTWLSNKFPSHRLNWAFHLGAAESLYHLKQTDRASKEFQNVAEKAPIVAVKAEAGLKVGDLFLERKQYAQALASYYKSTQLFKDEAENFLPMQLNRAESLYWLKEYARAEVKFKEIIGKFKTKPETWRAYLRLAEIQGRKKGEKNNKIYRKYLYDTINLYPYSPGATLARLKLLPCGDHGGFTASSAERFFKEEAEKFDGKGEVITKLYPDFKKITEVRTWVSMGRTHKALLTSAKYQKLMIKKASVKVLKDSFRQIFRAQVLKLLAQGKKIEAIKEYEVYKWAIPKVGDPVASDYLLELADAASDLEFPALSTKLLNRYRAETTSLDRRIAKDKEDTDSHPEDRQKNSQEHLIEARNIWMEYQSNKAKQIRYHLKEIQYEHPKSFEAQMISGLLNFEEKKYKESLKDIVNSKLLISKMSPESEIRFNYMLAKINQNLGEDDIALDYFQKIESKVLDTKKEIERSDLDKLMDKLHFPRIPEYQNLVFEIGKVFESKGFWGKAASVYDRAVNNKSSNNRMLFSLGRALLKTKEKVNVQRGWKIYQEVANSKNEDFWKKLALQALNNKQAREGENNE